MKPRSAGYFYVRRHNPSPQLLFSVKTNSRIQATIADPGSMIENAILEGSCHCGTVKLRLPAIPEKGTRCNCSICRRIGAVWAYYEFGTVQIKGHPENTDEYIQGDRTLRTVRCRNCGCITHWEPLDPARHPQHGVNLNNFHPTLLERVNVRRFDGADTWTFIE